jgi:hypothetical protein
MTGSSVQRTLSEEPIHESSVWPRASTGSRNGRFPSAGHSTAINECFHALSANILPRSHGRISISLEIFCLVWQRILSDPCTVGCRVRYDLRIGHEVLGTRSKRTLDSSGHRGRRRMKQVNDKEISCFNPNARTVRAS